MNQVIEDLPFEVVAVSEDVVPPATSYTTPIKVKIKMKKGDKRGISRQGVISVPKFTPTYPVITRRVHSDETIMSFNIHMDPEPESNQHRKSQNKFFHLFKTGVCLNTENEDDNDPPYMLATVEKSNDVNSQRLNIKNRKKQLSLSKGNFNTKTSSKPPKFVFGKCKPGGCLDPPFGEDNYEYYPSFQTKPEFKGKEVENLQKTLIENLKEDIVKSKNSKMTVKSSDKLDASSTYMLYRADSKNNIPKDEQSDSIITYPTRTSSVDLSILEKRAMSRKSSSIKAKQLNMNTYFTPSKVNKSSERKIESENKESIDHNKVPNKEVKNSLPYNTPNSKYTQEAILSQELDISEKNISMVAQSNHKLTEFFSSGNILLALNQIKEPKGSFETKSDERVTILQSKEVNSCFNENKNVTENIIKRAIEDTSDKISILEVVNSFHLENLEKPPKTDELNTSNPNTFQSNTEQVFDKNNAENHQQEKKTLNTDLTVSLTNMPVTEKEYHKRMQNITNTNVLNTEDRYTTDPDRRQINNSHDEHQNKAKELSTRFSHKTKENSAEISISGTEEDKPQVSDLDFKIEKLPKVDGKDYKFVIDFKKPDEELLEGVKDVTDSINSLSIDKKDDKQLQIHKYSDIHSIHQYDNEKDSIYSDYNNKDYLNEEKSLSNNLTLQNVLHKSSNNIIESKKYIPIDTGVEKLKETKSITKLNTANDLKDEFAYNNNVPLSASFNAINTLSDFSFDKNKTSNAHTTHESNDHLLLDNNETTIKHILATDNAKKLDQYEEKEKLSNENISENKTFKDNISFAVEDTRLNTNENFTTLTLTNDMSSSYVIENMNTNFKSEDRKNYIIDTKDSINQEKPLDKDTNVITPVLNEYLPLSSVPALTKYKPLDTSLSTLSVGNVGYAYIGYPNESASLKDIKSYQDVNNTSNNANIPAQHLLSQETLTGSKNQTKLPNKNDLIVATIGLKTNTDPGVPYYITSKENIASSHDKSSLELDIHTAIPPPMISLNRITYSDAHLSSNVSRTRKELSENKDSPIIQFYKKSLDTTKKDIKSVEYNPFNDAKKIKSQTSLNIVKKETILVDLGFQAYVNENGETIIKTFDVSQEPQRYAQDRIFVTKSVSGLNDRELSFEIDSNTRLSIKVRKTIKESDEISFNLEGSRLNDTIDNAYRNTKMFPDISDVGTLQESLNAIYENDLIPIERLIRNLRLELDQIAKYRHSLRKKPIVPSKKLKPTYSKRCVCIRK